MNEVSKKARDLLEYEVKAYENIKKDLEQHIPQHQRRIDLIRGAGLGLTLGIMGNLFVQYFFAVFNEWVKQELRFGFNVSVLICSFIIVMVATWDFVKRLRKEEREEKTAKESLEIMQKAIARRKLQLEKEEKH